MLQPAQVCSGIRQFYGAFMTRNSCECADAGRHCCRRRRQHRRRL